MNKLTLKDITTVLETTREISPTSFISTLENIIIRTFYTTGYFSYYALNGIEYRLSYGQDVNINTLVMYAPYILLEQASTDSEDDVEFNKVDRSYLFPLGSENDAVTALLSLMYGIKSRLSNPEDFGAMSLEQLREYYQSNPLKQVVVKIHDAAEACDLGVIGNSITMAKSECPYTYYNDGKEMMVVYPSQRHLDFVKRRLSNHTYAKYFTEIPRGYMTDQLRTLDDNKLLNVIDLQQMMLVNYNTTMRMDVAQVLVNSTYLNKPPSDLLSAIITVKTAKAIQVAHNIDMS